ncbi:hypothetical protein [uncultured Duncaniella sp.]|uniref:hypothetical protein n=1 Tax=uncultured Duncaniella sp. TaxID=2768039 RepID=UPI0025AFF429|nr:hypothetical protein [uncultured Duncaniella sp.]
MSKTTVKKSLEGFDAGELRQLILDIYTKSKEAKEILDFYAVPDIAKKLDEYKKRGTTVCETRSPTTHSAHKGYHQKIINSRSRR